MATTAEYLSALIAARNELSQNILAAGGSVTGTKYGDLAQDVRSIVWGDTHYLTGSGTLNKSGEHFPSVFTVTTPFLPARFCANFSSVLSGSYSDNVSYTMIGRLIIPGISRNNGQAQPHTVTLQTGIGGQVTAQIYTTVQSAQGGGYTLTVSLPTTPERYVFRGAFDWLCVDADWEGDDDE